MDLHGSQLGVVADLIAEEVEAAATRHILGSQPAAELPLSISSRCVAAWLHSQHVLAVPRLQQPVFTSAGVIRRNLKCSIVPSRIHLRMVRRPATWEGLVSDRHEAGWPICPAGKLESATMD